ncbi:MAG: hypothetical protein CMK59_00375 [Proteobacteria bacterium]|nr:hypothetical protein [Pseudomonadota bacterium]
MSNVHAISTINLSTIDALTDTIRYTDLKTTVFRRNYDLPSPKKLEIKEPLGQGGMGVVYLANQAHPKREVAIKRLKKVSKVLQWALYQEAMIMGALEHPTIIPVHKLHLTGDHVPEVVMKRVQGQSMMDLLENSEGTDAEQRKLLNALCRVCNGLEYAHSKNIIHRDVKLDNIMIGAFGEVYLLDWGIAVQKAEAISLPVGLVGTPAYMAPEMLSGDPKDVDVRTDVYLLGSTLHHILTGLPRHSGDNLEDVLESVKRSEPYVYDDDISDMLGELINAACHLDPDLRPQTAGAFRARILESLEYSQAYMISRAALTDLEELERLVSISHPSKSERHAIHRHFNRSRFGFEQSLDIWPDFEEGKERLEQSISCMAKHYLSLGQIEAAQQLLDDVTTVSPLLKLELKRQQKVKAQMDQDVEEIRRYKMSNPTSTQLFRFIFTASVVMSCGIFMYYLFQVDDLNPNKLSPRLLFYQSIAMTLPIAPAFLVARSRLLANANGRRAAMGVSGALVAMLLHRWVAMSYDEIPASIIVTDLFIIGLGLMNTTPAIRYGRWLGFLCVSVGILNHLLPITFWPGSLIVSVAIVVCIVGDWTRNWNV